MLYTIKVITLCKKKLFAVAFSNVFLPNYSVEVVHMASSFSLFCRNCGTQNSANESFCASCGYALSAATVAAAAPLTPPGQLPPATLLKQRYRVRQTAGQGGMGAVYQAEDTQLGDRMVAIKEMSQGNLSGKQAQDAAADFKREAHLLAGLQHPNLPSIHDYFEEAGRWYLVMSFIEGETLADYLAVLSTWQHS